MLHYADPIFSSYYGIQPTKEDGFVRYTATSSTSSDRYVHIYMNGTEVTGKYVVIKYRAYDPAAGQLSLRPYYAGSLAGGANAANGNGDALGSSFGAFIADGEWHYQIVQVPDSTLNHSSSKFLPNDDGTYTWRYLRIGFNATTTDGSAYLDIASLAFADNIEAVENYISSSVEECTHGKLINYEAFAPTCDEDGCAY